MVAQLRQLVLSNIRNLDSVDLKFGAKFNVFIGPNGSGKTSLLEAIYLLGVGRSFRARSIQQVISFGEDQCLVRAQIRDSEDLASNGVWLGVKRELNGDAQYRVGEQVAKSSADLTKLLPVQLIDVNSHLLLEGGPNYRRQFVDWGVFHVEHTFLQSWRQMRRALEQRNAILKKRQTPPAVWNEAFIKYSAVVDDARRAYVQHFSILFKHMLQQMLNITGVELQYQRGWSDDKDLAAALSATAGLDLAYGYTNRGPHRADLAVLIDGRPVKAVLSRGQLKLFVSIMLLARAQMLKEVSSGVFLIDDLNAELDKTSCEVFIEAIDRLGCQVFITGIEEELLKSRLQGCAAQLFHVEQGCISSGG